MIYSLLKRATDILCALLGIALTSPLWLLAALGILVSDPGPVFYVARRVGKGDRPFAMYKFRSMRVARGASEASLRPDADRVFPLGRLLRATKVDELPQLLNVLNGTMSLVGPRPVAQDQLALFRTGRWDAAAAVPAGLTGPAALYDYLWGDRFTDEAEYMRRVFPTRRELEYVYTLRRGALYDLRLVLLTAVCVVRSSLGMECPRALRWLEGEARAFGMGDAPGDDTSKQRMS